MVNWKGVIVPGAVRLGYQSAASSPAASVRDTVRDNGERNSIVYTHTHARTHRHLQRQKDREGAARQKRPRDVGSKGAGDTLKENEKENEEVRGGASQC